MKTTCLNQLALTSLLCGILTLALPLRAEEANTTELIRQLQQQINELQQKVKTLEAGRAPIQPAASVPADTRVQELDKKVTALTEAAAKAKEAPQITVGEKGFGVASRDGNFAVQLKGLLQIDTRTFVNDGGTVGNDGIVLRRARPILQGTVYKNFDFQFVPDFGGSGNPTIMDAYVNYKYSPELQLQAGKYKAPVGLEQLQADKDTLFTERGLPTVLVPNRDLGFDLHGDLLGGSISYAAGIFNGVGDGRSSSNVDFEDNRSFAGRVFLQPFKTSSLGALQNFGFGLGTSYDAMQSTNTTGLPASLVSASQQTFFSYNPTTGTVVADGEHWRLSPQGTYSCGPFGLLAEYVISDQKVYNTSTKTTARLQNTAWQVAAGWMMTGEDFTFGTVTPRHPFNPLQGDWGAWQLVARYSQLDIDPNAFPVYSNPLTSASAAQEWQIGVDWFLNRNLRFNTSFSHITFTGGATSGARAAESIVFTRMQLAF